MSVKLDAAIRAHLAAAGDQPIDLIIRTKDKPAQYAATCAALGVQVQHTYNLLPGMAVSAPASVVLRLADEPWVVGIEEDRAVRTM
jgi:hypothetical protein